MAATIRLLKEDNEQGRLDSVITCLEGQAQHFALDPDYSWSVEAQKVLSPDMMQEVIERYAQVSRGLAYYI
ncbi:MAG TPA: hypothetical protein VFV38_50990 [Ktedonobacteraceae bacterium]|nr:hypothetical protein [Ktedonobacteraceae bacterium]